MKRCPYCAEEIQDAATVCRHCGRDLEATAQAGGIVPHAAPQAGTNGLAIASLVLGILWLYGLGSILALVFGYTARSQIESSDGGQSGRGLAIAGIVLGWIGVALTLLGVVGVILVPRVS